MPSTTRLLTLFACAALAACGASNDPAPAAAPAEPAPVEEPSIAWSDLLPNARKPLKGVVSGGQPSDDQLQLAATAGYKTVINLRMPSEDGLPNEAERVAELGMNYVSFPISGAEGITEDNARGLTTLLDEAESPILLHCGSGNRIGALLALSAFHVRDWGIEDALAYGLESGLTRLEPVVVEHLESFND